jgi:hypothetical protein
MEAADWMYVGLSVLLQAIGLSMLGYAWVAPLFGRSGNLSYTMLAFLAGVTISLLGLHGVGVVWQLPHRPFSHPMPVFVMLCLDVLVGAVLLLALLMWVL